MSNDYKNRLLHRWSYGGREYRIIAPGKDVRGGTYTVEKMDRDALECERWTNLANIDKPESDGFDAKYRNNRSDEDHPIELAKILIEAIEQLSSKSVKQP